MTTVVDGAHPWAPELWVDVGEKHGLHGLNASPQYVSRPQKKERLYTEAPSRRPLSPDRGRHRRPRQVHTTSSVTRCTGQGPTSFLRYHRGPKRATSSRPGRHHTDARRAAAPCKAAGDTFQGTEIGRPGRPRACPADGGPRRSRAVSGNAGGLGVMSARQRGGGRVSARPGHRRPGREHPGPSAPSRGVVTGPDLLPGTEPEKRDVRARGETGQGRRSGPGNSAAESAAPGARPLAPVPALLLSGWATRGRPHGAGGPPSPRPRAPASCSETHKVPALVRAPRA